MISISERDNELDVVNCASAGRDTVSCSMDCGVASVLGSVFFQVMLVRPTAKSPFFSHPLSNVPLAEK